MAGSTRLGDYELITKLGEGGMGAVYKARQISLDRLVALKVLPKRLAADQDFLQRFIREARACAKLSHPNVVAGIDVNCADGYFYFAMEYVEGTTLGARMRAEGPLPEIEVVRIGAAIASALAHAHSAGIVHRDVKPDNLLLDAIGTPKLADLGLAKALAKEDSSLTQTGVTVGTPHYMSPEQVRGQVDVDGRTDVYSLGCALYHAAVGRTPFVHEVSAVLMTKHLTEKMQHPQSLRPDLSDNFCNVLSHMVAREPADRYESADEAAQDLEALLAGAQPLCGPMPAAKSNFMIVSSTRGTTARGVRPVGANTTKRQTAVGVATQSGRQRAQSNPDDKKTPPWVIPAVVGIVVLIAGMFAYAFLGGSDRTSVAQGGAATNSALPQAPAPPSHPSANTAAAPTNTAPKVNPQPEAPGPAQPGPSQPGPRFQPGPGGPRYGPGPQPGRLLPPDQRQTPAPETRAFLPLFNGRDLEGWRVQMPSITVEEGALVARAPQTGNASAARFRALPKDFELKLSVRAERRFHIGWTASDGMQSWTIWAHKEQDGQLRIQRSRGALETLAEGASGATTGRHSLRYVVWHDVLRIYVDGTLALQTKDSEHTAAASRDLYLFGGYNSRTDFYEVSFRNLSQVTTLEELDARRAPARPAVALFNGRDLSDWRAADKWQVADGAMVGRSTAGNISAQKARALPAEFELTLEGDFTGPSHFGWSAGSHLAHYFYHEANGTVRLGQYKDSQGGTEFQRAPRPLPNGKHRFQFVVRAKNIRVYCDDALLLNYSADFVHEPPQQSRDLFCFCGERGEVKLRKVEVVDLTGTVEDEEDDDLPAPAVAARHNEQAQQILKLLELKEDVAALRAYSALVQDLQAAWSKLDAKAGGERLTAAEKEPALKSFAPQLKQSKRLLALLEDVLKAEQEGAAKLKDLDSFEIALARGGEPLRVGKKEKYKALSVTKDAVEVGNAGVSMAQKFSLMSFETRQRLAELSLGRDGPGLLRRAFAATLHLKVPPEANSDALAKTLLAKAAGAEAPAEDFSAVENWLKALDEAALQSAAVTIWSTLPPLAAAQNWKALKQGLTDFNTAFAATPFGAGKQAEIQTAMRLLSDLQAVPRGTPDEQTQFLKDSLREANPGFNGELGPQFERGKLVGLTFHGQPQQVRDITPLKGLQLKYLNLRDTRVADLSPVRDMPLEHLTLTHTRVADLSPLAGKQLRVLEATGCEQLSDISVVKGMPLFSLNISFSSVADLAPLQDLANLQHLQINRIKTEDYAPLAKLKNLRVLTLDYRPEKHKELIKSMSSLQTINGLQPQEFWRQQEGNQ